MATGRAEGICKVAEERNAVAQRRLVRASAAGAEGPSVGVRLRADEDP